jgi:hypothetical protein
MLIVDNRIVYEQQQRIMSMLLVMIAILLRNSTFIFLTFFASDNFKVIFAFNKYENKQ